MKNKIILTLIFLIFFALNISMVKATPVIHANVEARANGFVCAECAFQVSDSGQGVNSASASASLGGASASASVSSGVIRGSSIASGNPPYGVSVSTFSSVQASWNDRLFITDPINFAPRSLLFTFEVDGTLSADLSGDGASQVAFLAGSSSLQYVWSGRVPTNIGFTDSEISSSFDLAVISIHGELTVSFDNLFSPGGESGLFFPHWSLILGSGAFNGLQATNFESTAKLTSITLPDGTTPESQGISLQFESGMQSPNITSLVPEPGTIALMGLGLVSLFGFGPHQRRLKWFN